MSTEPQTQTNERSLPEFHGETIEQWLELVGALRVEFLRNPKAYPSDAEKVGLALSRFRGQALVWLNTHSDKDIATWAGSYTVFQEKLRGQWGLTDTTLIVRGRQRLDELRFDIRSPETFFQEATICFNWQGIHSDSSRLQGVWHKMPPQVKDMLVARNSMHPSWETLRLIASQVALIQPTASQKGKKPKCKTCGKKHDGECRSKN